MKLLELTESIKSRIYDLKSGEKATLTEIIGMVLLVVSVGLTATFFDARYAKNLEFEGEIVSIVWRTSNHGLPEIIIKEKNNNDKKLSHFTISLKPKDINVGDYIVKKKGSMYSSINGKSVKFSKNIKIIFAYD